MNGGRETQGRKNAIILRPDGAARFIEGDTMLLRIHRDGRLVVVENQEKDRVLDVDDPFALAQAFRAKVEFEEGLTSAQLLRGLSPWTKLLSASAWMNFDAWLAAAERPRLSVVGVEGDAQNPPLDAVVVSPKLVAWLGKAAPDPSETHFRWETFGRFASPQPNSFGGLDKVCSLSFADPASWMHLPLLIDENVRIDIYRSRRKRKETPDPFRDVTLTTFPSFFDAIVLGFLDDISFEGSPSELAEKAESLKALVEEAKADYAAKGHELSE